MRIKKFAVTAAALAAIVGTLSLAIAVGRSTSQESAPSDDDRRAAEVAPERKAIGGQKRARHTSTKTYYVGDVLGLDARTLTGTHIAGDGGQPIIAVRPLVDMRAVTELITATIAPGTWRFDGINESDAISESNAIVPFYLSFSLIVRCPEEVHDQVANTMRLLRMLLEIRDRQKPPNAPDANAAQQPAAARPAPGTRQRLQRLLDELQQEVAKLPSE